MENLTKSIVIPLDGSKNSLKSLDYLDLIYGPKHNLEVSLLYILPSLPPILTDEKTMDRKTRARLAAVKQKNIEMGERILAEGRDLLLNKGFKKESIKVLCQKMGITVAQDIYYLAKHKRVDTILLTRRGRSDIKTFFMGEVSSRLVEYCRDCPVWIVDGGIHSKKVLIGVDSSENALRAVEHAAFMLSGTDCKVTLFYTMRHLRRFIPLEVLEEAAELEELWQHKAGKEIAPYLQRAKIMLLKAGFTEDRIGTKVVDGTRSAADDILKEAQGNDYETIVLGRRGLSAVKEFFMGSVTTKVLRCSAGLAIWIVQ
ncbi:MAG: hypothetical protein BA864_10380 [Desulfuromonadales bacterium C00003093]|nr:MAG: hypothetical protein BA864_10380 [Desulfuromonadales bacterium C00003093]